MGENLRADHARSGRGGVEAGVDAVGFVFAESKRKVTPQRAAELARDVPKHIVRVAVMLHPSQEQLDEVWSMFRPDVLQTDIEDLPALRFRRIASHAGDARGTRAAAPLPARCCSKVR